eukprot:6146_1
MTIFHASDGINFKSNKSGEFQLSKSINWQVSNVTSESILKFTVNIKKLTLPGLKCSIYYENSVYNTDINEQYVYWNVETTEDDDTIVKALTYYDKNQTPPDVISDDAQWIWNDQYKNKTYVKKYASLTFTFSFKHIKNVQNKPSDNCASISWYTPNKWKTNNCQSEFYYICNKRDHHPVFKTSPHEKFALLIDRTLTQAESTQLCQNIYGYPLATIYSYYEFSTIDKMLWNNKIHGAWIGLYYDNVTFINKNNMNYKYGWQTQKTFIYDTWTNLTWQPMNNPFPNPSIEGDCVRQMNGTTINESVWVSSDCSLPSHAVCNIDLHYPNFTESQLGSFYLLQDQQQNYQNGVEMCRDYVGLRSTGAIIYHQIENERAIWLCSNAANDVGCFIGYNNLPSQFSNTDAFHWENGARIDVFKFPWFDNPFQTNYKNITSLFDYKYHNEYTNTSYCTAIMKHTDVITNESEWKWDIIHCDNELNILCDSGDDHAQCWMLQNCAQCTLRSDCRWC